MYGEGKEGNLVYWWQAPAKGFGWGCEGAVSLGTCWWSATHRVSSDGESKVLHGCTKGWLAFV